MEKAVIIDAWDQFAGRLGTASLRLAALCRDPGNRSHPLELIVGRFAINIELEQMLFIDCSVNGLITLKG